MEQQNSCADCLNLGRAVYCMQCIRIGKEGYVIDLSVRQCQRLFHELGFSRIRPQTYPSLGESNEEERKAFKKLLI